jgi:hypothetical protein
MLLQSWSLRTAGQWYRPSVDPTHRREGCQLHWSRPRSIRTSQSVAINKAKNRAIFGCRGLFFPWSGTTQFEGTARKLTHLQCHLLIRTLAKVGHHSLGVYIVSSLLRMEM